MSCEPLNPPLLKTRPRARQRRGLFNCMKTPDQWLAEMPTGRLGLTEWIAAIQKEAFEEGFFKSSIALKLSWEALNGYPCYCASGERQHTCKRCLALMAIEWCLSRQGDECPVTVPLQPIAS